MKCERCGHANAAIATRRGGVLLDEEDPSSYVEEDMDFWLCPECLRGVVPEEDDPAVMAIVSDLAVGFLA